MATATMVHNRGYSWDWLRVGAWSGSFATHVGILLLVALPAAVPLTRQLPEPIVARWIETAPPPPSVPEPPPPTAPHRVRLTPQHTQPVPVRTPVTHEDTPMSLPVEDTTTATVAVEPADTSGASSDIGSGGATQMLAYANPLQPRYPPASARAHEEGIVVLRVLVDAGGVPQRVEIARSSGHSRLDAAAREAVMRGRFRPVMRDGEAASAWGIVPIEFRLDRG